ncbi:uncharacterized protein LOC116567092 [Mustela erminea]|uniref:uncharacterized protein LOC116567092 n=1 Tax=Mustela erminea TaxID=36723 RepID=UPI0013876178|nr:uncharacterized protein LOC116567092 [Mustela erminea]
MYLTLFTCMDDTRDPIKAQVATAQLFTQQKTGMQVRLGALTTLEGRRTNGSIVLVASEGRLPFSWRGDRSSQGTVLETSKEAEDGSRRIISDDSVTIQCWIRIKQNPKRILPHVLGNQHLRGERLPNRGLDKEENWCLIQGCLDQRMPGSDGTSKGHHQASSLTPPSCPRGSQSDHPRPRLEHTPLLLKTRKQAWLFKRRHPSSRQLGEEVSCELFVKMLMADLLQAKLYRKHILLGTGTGEPR